MVAAGVGVSASDLMSVRALLHGIPKGAETAIMRAVNQGVSTGKTQGVKAVGQKYTLKAARIKKDFTIKKANKSKLLGAVLAKGRPIGLLNFDAKKVKKGYSVKVLRNGSRSLLKRAFRAKATKVKNDGSEYSTEHLWWREYSGPRTSTGTANSGYFAGLPAGNKYKYPLERLDGPRIEDAFSAPGVLDGVQAIAAEKTATKLATEVKGILKKYG